MTTNGKVSSTSCTVDVRFAEWRGQSFYFALAIFARSGGYLFFRFFLAGLPDPRSDRTTRNSARRSLPSGGRAIPGALAAILVCAYGSLAFQWPSDAERAVLGGHDGLGASRAEPVASGNACRLFCLFSFLHRRGTGFFQLPIRWHVAGSGFYFVVLCATWLFPGARAKPCGLARQPFPSAVGMVPYLLRVWDGEDS